jgi:type I restriction enzyme, S subunit
MNKGKDRLVPELRFSEFVNDGVWEEKALKSVSEVVMGSSPSSSSYNENKIGLPLLQGNADIKNRQSAPRIYTSEVTKECEIGDILLSVRAPVGTVAKSLHKACIGRGISGIRSANKNSQEYIYQWLLSYESSWQNISQGGTFDAVNSDDIRNLLLPLPKPNEQQKIASCLSSLDEVITAHSQKLEALKEHKKGLMQSLFPREGERVPRLRFEEFEGDGEWVFEQFEKVYSFLVTNSFSRENLNHESGSVKNIHYGDIHTKFSTLFDITKEKASFINADVSIEKIRQECYCKEGDMIFADASEDLNDVGKSIEIVNVNNESLLSGLHTLLARQKEPKLITGFGGHLFLSNRIRNQIKREAQGAKVLGISGTRLSNVIIYYPKNKIEQQKIASCLSSLDEVITVQLEKIDQLKLHKKGLMQGLFPRVNN